LANSCVDFDFIVLHATLSNIAAISWRTVLVVDDAWITRKDSPTMEKQLVNFITCCCELSAPFCNLQSRTRTHAVAVIGLNELLGNLTT
jgi:hypothetical protein